MAGFYSVRIPVVGYAEIEVEAQNEEDAERVALEHATNKDIVELDYLRQIVVGYVFHGVLNSIETEYLGEVSDALD